MAKQITYPVSIEKFAAYLDGNLSLDETQEMADLIMNDSSLSEILNVNTNIDNQIHKMIIDGYEIPDDLASSDFTYPQLDNLKDIPNIDDIGMFTTLDDDFVNITDDVDNSFSEFQYPNHDYGGVDGNIENHNSGNNDSMNELGAQLDFGNNE